MSNRTYGHIVVFNGEKMIANDANRPLIFALTEAKAKEIIRINIDKYSWLIKTYPERTEYQKFCKPKNYKIYKVYINSKGELVTKKLAT